MEHIWRTAFIAAGIGLIALGFILVRDGIINPAGSATTSCSAGCLAFREIVFGSGSAIGGTLLLVIQLRPPARAVIKTIRGATRFVRLRLRKRTRTPRVRPARIPEVDRTPVSPIQMGSIRMSVGSLAQSQTSPPPPSAQDARRATALSALDSFLEKQADPLRKAQILEVRTKFAAMPNLRPGSVAYELAQLRRADIAEAAAVPVNQDSAEAIQSESEDRERTLLAMLPIDHLVAAECPHLDPDYVKCLILALIAPGSRHPYFGNNPIGYDDFRRIVAGKMASDAFDECYSWLNKAGVIADVKGGGAVRRARGRDHRRCALNLNHKRASTAAAEIITLAVRARQELDGLRKAP